MIPKRQMAMAFAPGIEAAQARAQRLANEKQDAQGVWEHVGCYGRPEGDIEARHTFKVQSLNKPDPPAEWALVACVDPEGV